MDLTRYQHALCACGMAWIAMGALGQGAAPVTVPMQVIVGLVYMQGQVNHSPPLNVVLDSGASLSIVSPTLAKAIDLKSTHNTEALGVGTGSSSTLHVIDDAELAWGNPESPMRLAHQSAAVYPIEYVSAQIGKRTDAIFGSSLFLHYTITVDYERGRVTFAPPDKEPSAAGNSIPIRFRAILRTLRPGWSARTAKR